MKEEVEGDMKRRELEEWKSVRSGWKEREERELSEGRMEGRSKGEEGREEKHKVICVWQLKVWNLHQRLYNS